MTGQLTASKSVYIDTDLALGSKSGDIDDAFAISAILLSQINVVGIGSVFGNTREDFASKNIENLARVCGSTVKILRGAKKKSSSMTPASELMRQCNARVLALGPLTNIAQAIKSNDHKISEIVAVTTNWQMPTPSLRFFDFNQACDRKATRVVVESNIPLTIVPCNIARQLRITEEMLLELPGTLGEYLQKHSHRWFRRAKWLKLSKTVPVWDLVAAMFVSNPALFSTTNTLMELNSVGSAIYGRGRKVKVITRFNAKTVWNEYVKLLFQKGPTNTGMVT